MAVKNRVLVRCRARLRDEHGFSLLETMFAVTLIFGSLLALAFTATIGFGYEALAREKQTATGIANQTMEEIRGLTYERLGTGLLTSDLASDSNIVSCGGSPVVYRFLSCTPGAVPGSGEKIVHSASATNPTVPLVPHAGTLVKNNVTFTRKAYVTNDCPAVSAPTCPKVNPYRVTVLVTWTAGRTAPNKLVRVQSLVFSPNGCRSKDTHPFAAPCQAFFFGTSTSPQGSVTVTATGVGISGTDFQSGQLLTGSADSAVQQEQLSQVQGGFQSGGVSVVDGSGTRTAGTVAGSTTAADADPGSGTPTYSTASLSPPDAGTVTSPSGGGSTQIAFTYPGGGSARSDSAVRAGGASVCPPPTDAAQTDLRPCGGSRQQQGGTLAAVLTMNGFSNALGTATVAQIGVQSNDPNKSFVNRVVFPEVDLCTPVSLADGCLSATTTRRVGTINIGALPSALTPPANWAGGNAWNGYFISIVGYQDRATAAAGTSAPLPTATVQAGTLYYWNGTGYSSLAVTSSSIDSLNLSSTFSWTGGGRPVDVIISTVSGENAGATTEASPTSPAGTATRTDVAALVTPPKIAIAYQVKIQNVVVVDLRIAVDLRQLVARAIYAAAPAEGS